MDHGRQAELSEEQRGPVHLHAQERAPWLPARRCGLGLNTRDLFPGESASNGGGQMEFILPSAVVLTSFNPTIVPVLGYVEDAGIDDENKHDPKEYRDDFYKGQTDSFVGTRSPFTTKIAVTGPADFTINSVGTKTSDRRNRMAAGASSGRAIIR